MSLVKGLVGYIRKYGAKQGVTYGAMQGVMIAKRRMCKQSVSKV